LKPCLSDRTMKRTIHIRMKMSHSMNALLTKKSANQQRHFAKTKKPLGEKKTHSTDNHDSVQQLLH